MAHVGRRVAGATPDPGAHATAGAVAAAPDREEHADHEQEGHRVQQERDRRAPGRDHDTGEQRPERACRVELRAVQRDRVQQQVPLDELGHEGLPDRRVHPRRQPGREGEHGEPRRRRRARGDQEPQRRGARRLRALARDQQRTAREAVGEPSSEQSHHHERHVLEEAGDADVARRAGQLERDERDRRVLHPGARVGHQRADPEAAERPLPQRVQRSGPLHLRRVPPSPRRPERPMERATVAA